MAERIRVARIGAAHGVRGDVKLWPFTQDPMDVTSYGELETEDGAQRFTIEVLRPAKDFLVARIAGVNDRDAAEKLKNLELFVPRERLPAIEDDDTYYHADLIGLAAVTAVDQFKYSAHVEIVALLTDRKSTRLNSSHVSESRMPSSA